MPITIETGALATLECDCLMIAASPKKSLYGAAATLNKAMEGSLQELINSDLDLKLGASLLLHQPKGIAARRLLILSSGASNRLSATEWLKLVKSSSALLKTARYTQVISTLSTLKIEGQKSRWAAEMEAQLYYHARYQMDACKSKPKTEPAAQGASQFALYCEEAKQQPKIQEAIQRGSAIAAGMALTRELSDLPANICTPSYLAHRAEELAEGYTTLETTLLDEEAMEQLGMGALLSVSRGSRQPAKLITLHYRGGAADEPPTVLIGKGITFDAGGISLKPAEAMDEMKYDMCGGAAVLGVIKAVAELHLPLNLIGLIPSSENLPDGMANKPGDIVTSLSGQTIEILNTDAEGRLILCDALTYAEQFKPRAVIDIATLTGACIVALGSHASGLMGNHPPLVKALLQAGDEKLDRAWELPLWNEYQEQLKSPFADMANIGGKKGGAITAGCFLSRFAQKFHWAHLDIAGTAWISGEAKGATGRPVPLLMQYLLNTLAD